MDFASKFYLSINEGIKVLCLGRELGLWSQKVDLAQVPLLSSCMPLGHFIFNFSGLQFSHLSSGDNNSSYLAGLSQGLNKLKAYYMPSLWHKKALCES